MRAENTADGSTELAMHRITRVETKAGGYRKVSAGRSDSLWALGSLF